jgi:hypothetical protein
MSEQQAPAAVVEKAYDLKVLVKKYKEVGLDLTEEAALKVFKTTFGWVKESAAVSKNPYDDMIVGIAAPLEKVVESKIDQIDGQVG